MDDPEEEKKMDGAFGECLRFLISEHGARPGGSPDRPGTPWKQADFARAVGCDPRTISYWLKNQKLPNDTLTIERELFGPGKQFDPWRAKLRAALWRTKAGSVDAPQTETAVRPNAQILHPEIRAMPDFTGREELLDAIGAALWRKGGTAALTDTGAGRASNSGAAQAAVRGMGGVGKSVLARAYGWRNREAYRGVWWVRAETETTAIDDLIELGSRLVPALAEVQERDGALHLALDAIMQTGAGGKPWLIVYDNAESPAALDRLTPATSAHALITSRWSDWHGHAEELPVDVFPPEIALDYLLAHTRHPDRDAAARLAEALGRLPLALAHARATCWRYNWSFDAYRAKLPELIRKELAKPDDKAIVYATFDLAIAKVAETHPAAEQLMGIAAFLAPDRIPLDLFTAEIMSEEERDDAVAALADVSLIEHDTLTDGARAFTVHRLVQEVMRSRLGDDRQASRQIALRLMHNTLAPVAVHDHVNWPRVAILLPHALAVVQDAPDTGGGAASTSAICDDLGVYFRARGDYTTATPYSTRALGIAEGALGNDHATTGARLNNLALLYCDQGRYAEAEPLYLRALALTEAALGNDHAETGARLNNLAALYRDQGRYAEAEPLYLRALALTEAALGNDHATTGTSLNNLALLYRDQGRYAEAEPLFLRALAITEAALGNDHAETGARLNNLALLYQDQGRYAEAEPLLERAMKIFEAALGPDHPSTRTVKANYGLLLTEKTERERGGH
jgi:tetratricopeptide (TPR) repeat protein